MIHTKEFLLNKKFIIIACAVLAAAVLGTVCALLLLKGVQKGIPADSSEYSQFSDTAANIGTNEDGSDAPSEPEDTSPRLIITSPSSTKFTTTLSTAVISGTSDPAEKLFLNGKELPRNPDGSFAYEAALKRGENIFTLEHKGDKKVCTITYRYVVINGYSPSTAQKYTSGSTFAVAVLARPGSTVSASFSGKTVALNQTGTLKEGEEFVEFSGSFSLPKDNIDDLNLGKVKFTGSFDGVTESFYSGNITCLKNEALANVPYIAEIVDFTAETFNGDSADDLSRPTNNYLPQGTVDYCDKALVYNGSLAYVKLRCGRRVYTEKPVKPDLNGQKTAVVRRYQGTLPDHNEISFVSFTQGDRHTTLTVDCMWKAPFFFDMLPQSYANPVKQDYTVTDTTFEYIDITFCYSTVYRGTVNIPEGNQIFSRAEIRKSGNNTVLRLYLKKKGVFYGWDCYYNANGQLVFDFLNPKNTVKASNKYGVSLEGAVILVDAGHGGIDPGAIGTDGSYEAARNLNLANKIKAELEALGATVHMTRTSNVNVTYDARRQLLKKLKPDYSISLHHDSAGNAPSANGFSVFYGQPFSFDAAKAVFNRTAQAGIYKTQRSLGWHYFFLTQMTACPAVIIENGFMSNYTDMQGIASDSINQKKAEAIVKGIADYFISIQYEEPKPLPTPTPTPEPEPEPDPEPEVPSVPEVPVDPEPSEPTEPSDTTDNTNE